MPAKDYKGRINRALNELREDDDHEAEHVGEDCSLETYSDLMDLVVFDWQGRSDDDVVRRIFEESNSDPHNFYHWYKLLSIFAEVHFRSAVNVPKQDTKDVHVQLLIDYDAIAAEQKTPNKLEVCRLLKKRFPDRYRDRKATDLNRLLSHLGRYSGRKRRSDVCKPTI